MESRTARGASRSIRLLALYATACAHAALNCGAWAAEAKERVFELTIAGGALPAAQRLMRVGKGDAVRLRLTGDAAGEVHLHAYRLEARVTPDEPAVMSFNAFATGRFRLEWHPAAAAAVRSQHAPPLAILEVHPK